MEFNKENRVLFARLMILGGLIYPTWGIFVHYFRDSDPTPGFWRLPIGVVAILVGVFHKSLGKYFLFAIHTTLTLFMLQFGFLMTANGGNETYLFGSLVLMLGIFIGFLNYPKAFLVHALICSATFLGLCSYFQMESKYFAGVRQMIMLYIVMYIITRFSRSHMDTIEKLRLERLQLLDEHKTMITENLKNAQSVFTSLAATESELPAEVSLKSFYRPAGDAGGDWIGHFYLKEKNWLILTIGDVTGHDLASSLVTIAVAGAARGTFESLSTFETDLTQLVKQMAISSHLAIKHCGVVEKSMTAAFLGIDISTFKGIYINCAHPAGLWQDQLTAQPIDSEGSQFLGDDDFKITAIPIDLSSMKSILLYTDGLVENRENPISEKRLCKWMETSKDFHQELSNTFNGIEIQDDVSYLLLEKLV